MKKLKKLKGEITDQLGWLFCECSFIIVNRWYDNKLSRGKLLDSLVNKLYVTGCWFYAMNKNHE